MGRATIVEHLGRALYTIDVHRDSQRTTALEQVYRDEAASISSTLPALEAEANAALAAVNKAKEEYENLGSYEDLLSAKDTAKDNYDTAVAAWEPAAEASASLPDLQQEVDDAQTELDSAISSLEATTTEVEAYDTAVDDLEVAEANLEAATAYNIMVSNHAIHAAIITVRGSAASASPGLSNLQVATDKALYEVGLVSSAIGTAATRMGTFNTAAVNLESAVAELKGATLVDDLAVLKQAVSDAAVAAENARNAANLATPSLYDLQIATETAVSELFTMTTAIGATSTEMEAYGTALSDFKAVAAGFEVVTSQPSAADAVVAAGDAALLDTSSLSNVQTAVNNTLTKLKRDVSATVEAAAWLESYITALTDFDTAVANFDTAVSHLEAAASTDDLVTLQQAVDDAAAQVVAAGEAVVAAGEAVVASSASLPNLQQEVSDAQTELDSATAVIGTTVTQIEAYYTALNTFEADVNNFEASTVNDVETAQQAVDDATAAVDNASQALNATQPELDAYGAASDAYDTAVSTRDEASALSVNLSTLEAEVTLTEETLDDATTTLESRPVLLSAYLTAAARYYGPQQKYLAMKMRVQNLIAKADDLQKYTEKRRTTAWCSTFTTTLAPGTLVGTAEVSYKPEHRFLDLGIIIVPLGEAPTEDDGQLRSVMSMTPAQAFLNYALFPGAATWRRRYSTGTVTEIDRPGNKLLVAISNSDAADFVIQPRPYAYQWLPIDSTCEDITYQIQDYVLIKHGTQGDSVIGWAELPRKCATLGNFFVHQLTVFKDSGNPHNYSTLYVGFTPGNPSPDEFSIENIIDNDGNRAVVEAPPDETQYNIYVPAGTGLGAILGGGPALKTTTGTLTTMHTSFIENPDYDSTLRVTVDEYVGDPRLQQRFYVRITRLPFEKPTPSQARFVFVPEVGFLSMFDIYWDVSGVGTYEWEKTTYIEWEIPSKGIKRAKRSSTKMIADDSAYTSWYPPIIEYPFGGNEDSVFDPVQFLAVGETARVYVYLYASEYKSYRNRGWTDDGYVFTGGVIDSVSGHASVKLDFPISNFRT